MLVRSGDLIPVHPEAVNIPWTKRKSTIFGCLYKGFVTFETFVYDTNVGDVAPISAYFNRQRWTVNDLNSRFGKRVHVNDVLATFSVVTTATTQSNGVSSASSEAALTSSAESTTSSEAERSNSETASTKENVFDSGVVEQSDSGSNNQSKEKSIIPKLLIIYEDVNYFKDYVVPPASVMTFQNIPTNIPGPMFTTYFNQAENNSIALQQNLFRGTDVTYLHQQQPASTPTFLNDQTRFPSMPCNSSKSNNLKTTAPTANNNLVASNGLIDTLLLNSSQGIQIRSYASIVSGDNMNNVPLNISNLCHPFDENTMYHQAIMCNGGGGNGSNTSGNAGILPKGGLDDSLMLSTTNTSSFVFDMSMESYLPLNVHNYLINGTQDEDMHKSHLETVV